MIRELLCLLILALPLTLSARTLSFATEATYPPFEYVSEDGDIEGFDIDIAKALCKQLEAECTFSNQPWTSLIPSLQLGKFDALIASMSITEEREQEVSFTDSYYKNSGSFVVPTDEDLDLSIAGLQGKKIGVQSGTVLGDYIRSTYGKGVKLNFYASIMFAFIDMDAERTNAVFCDTPIAQSWLKKQTAGDYHLVGDPVTDPEYFGKGFGIAVKKGNTDLVNALNQALTQIKANGTYDDIIEKYFGHTI